MRAAITQDSLRPVETAPSIVFLKPLLADHPKAEAGASAREIALAIVESAFENAGEIQEDDVTVLVVRRT